MEGAVQHLPRIRRGLGTATCDHGRDNGQSYDRGAPHVASTPLELLRCQPSDKVSLGPRARAVPVRHAPSVVPAVGVRSRLLQSYPASGRQTEEGCCIHDCRIVQREPPDPVERQAAYSAIEDRDVRPECLVNGPPAQPRSEAMLAIEG